MSSNDGEARRALPRNGEGADNIRDRCAKEKREMLEEKIRNLSQLNHRDRFVLENRIMSDQPLTLQEIGKQFSISRERVRQVEDRIWKSLKRELKRTVLAREAFRPNIVPERAVAVG